MRRTVPDTEAMEALGRELGRELRAGDLLVLTGPLGAGKTTLTRGIGEGLGVRGPVQSPTFVLARTHPNLAGGPPLVHVDAYRLGGAAELEDLDLDFARSAVVVEWGAGLLDGVSDSWLEVVIARRRGDDGHGAESGGGPGATSGVEFEEDEPRTVDLLGHGPRWAGTPYATQPELEP
jgi:tRNA threonylcarbamoyladenosine biosynthesis protein TsaE